MKGTLLRAFSAMIVVSLAITVVLTDLYAHRQIAEKVRTKVERLQREQLASIETDQQKRMYEEQERNRQRQLEEEQKQKETYFIAALNDGTVLFTNKVDGYSIQIPGAMKADMRYSNVRTVLESESLKIEIYRQIIDNTTGSSVESYVNYPISFWTTRLITKKLKGSNG